MRILLAPTAFKGSYSPAQIAEAFAAAVRAYAVKSSEAISLDILPVADGGDGTVESLALAIDSKLHRLPVAGSQDEPRQALWLEFKGTAVIELASACGIAGSKKSELNPLKAHTRGLGTVIKHVIENTALSNIVLALGGSASTDGGAAALAECGAEFFDSQGKSFFPLGGAALRHIADLDFTKLDAFAAGRRFLLATDVENPLLGKMGAAFVFGPQKGASEVQVLELDAALAHFADLVEQKRARLLRDFQGVGAAGGSAFGLVAGFDAKIVSGFDWFSSLVKLQERVAKSDLIITGEGRIDQSTFQGKVIGALQKSCTEEKKRLWLLAGSVEEGLSSKLESSVEKIVAVGSTEQFADLERIRGALFNTLEKNLQRRA